MPSSPFPFLPCSIQLDDNAVGKEAEKQPRKFTVKIQELGKAAKTEDHADAGKILVPSHAAPEVFAKVIPDALLFWP